MTETIIDLSQSAPDTARIMLNNPPHRNGNVVLRDGSTVRVRRMLPTDDTALLGLFTSLSDESLWLRFFGPTKGAAPGGALDFDLGRS